MVMTLSTRELASFSRTKWDKHLFMEQLLIFVLVRKRPSTSSKSSYSLKLAPSFITSASMVALWYVLFFSFAYFPSCLPDCVSDTSMIGNSFMLSPATASGCNRSR